MSIKIIAYTYSNPLLETSLPTAIWGLEIDRVYQDIGDRTSLNQLIIDCQLNPPDYLLIRRLDELGDNIADIGDRLGRLESIGIEIITTQEDYASSKFNEVNNHQLKDKLSTLFHQIYANKQSIRIKEGHARNRLKILPPPGKATYGYRRGQDKYIIDKSTAPVVKDFFERFLLYGSLRGAVKYLEKRYGKKISPSTGKNWLTNPVYRGDLKYKNQDLICNTHTAIITREEAAQIDRLLRRNSELASRTASAPRSLAGLVVCNECQLMMNITRVTQHHHKKEYLYLRCKHCPQKPKCKAISYTQVLSRVIDKICLELPFAVAQLDLPDRNSIENNLKQEIEDKKNILNQLPSLLEQGILDSQTFAIRNYKIRTEISQLETKIAQLPPGNLKAIASAVSLPQFWLDLSEAERRFYFREFIRQIKIIRNQSTTWELQLVFIF